MQWRISTMTTMDVWYDHPPRFFYSPQPRGKTTPPIIPEWLASPLFDVIPLFNRLIEDTCMPYVPSFIMYDYVSLYA